MTTTIDSEPAARPGKSPRPENPPDVRRRRGILAVAGAGLLFALVALLVRVGATPLLSLDHAVATGLNGVVAPRPALVRVLTAVTTLGSAGVLIWLVVLAVIVLLTRRRYRLAAYLAVTTLGAVILDPTLKALFGRLRPVVPDPVAFGGGNSFPSGHALDSLICYGALVLVFLPALPARRRWLLRSGAATLIVLIGLSRVMLGVHFVSDVVGAWSLGIAWLGLTVYAFELDRAHLGRRVPQPLTEGLEPEAAPDVRPTRPRSEEGSDRPRTIAWLVVGWVFVLGVVVGLGELVVRQGKNSNLLGDQTVPHWLADHRTATLNAVSDFWSQAGNTHAILAVGLIGGAVALGVTRSWRPVVFLVVLMMGELGLFLAAAKIVGRDRPDVSHLDGPLPTSAFPSGHVAATICLYAGLTLLVLTSWDRTGRNRRGDRTWWRWLVLVPAIAMSLLVGASRMYRGMHHPTDELASLLLAAAWIAVVYLAVRPNMYGDQAISRRRVSNSPIVPGSTDQPIITSAPTHQTVDCG